MNTLQAKKLQDSETLKCLDETLLLWEKMMNADFDHDQQIIECVRALQTECLPMSDELFSLINKIGWMQGWDDYFSVMCTTQANKSVI
jgi:hypothetical protein